MGFILPTASVVSSCTLASRFSLCFIFSNFEASLPNLFFLSHFFSSLSINSFARSASVFGLVVTFFSLVVTFSFPFLVALVFGVVVVVALVVLAAVFFGGLVVGTTSAIKSLFTVSCPAAFFIKTPKSCSSFFVKVFTVLPSSINSKEDSFLCVVLSRLNFFEIFASLK